MSFFCSTTVCWHLLIFNCTVQVSCGIVRIWVSIKDKVSNKFWLHFKSLWIVASKKKVLREKLCIYYLWEEEKSVSFIKMQTTASSDVVVGCTNICFCILPTSHFMFSMLLRRRICFPIRSFLSGDCFLYSYPLKIVHLM